MLANALRIKCLDYQRKEGLHKKSYVKTLDCCKVAVFKYKFTYTHNFLRIKNGRKILSCDENFDQKR